MLKFPYGLADFGRIRTQGYVYVDRTAYIHRLETLGDALVFLRPRRFGKSLWLDTLRRYYDLRGAEDFERIFGGLAVAGEPTPLRSRYFVLVLDFSDVDPRGDVAEIGRRLDLYVNDRIVDFLHQYREHLPAEVPISEVATNTLRHLLTVLRETPYKLYLLIDEYDNFINEVMVRDADAYRTLVRADGPFKAFFKSVKSATRGEGLERIFLTGVSPVALNDLSSGFNIARDVSQHPRLADLCGFTESELRHQILERMVEVESLPAERVDETQKTMRDWYDGYCFSPRSSERLLNPTHCIHLLQELQELGSYPEKLHDRNLAMDQTKLAFLSREATGARLIEELTEGEGAIDVLELESQISLEDLMTRVDDDRGFLASFLYYLGLLTFVGDPARQRLGIPNLAVRKLYLDRLLQIRLPAPEDQSEAEKLALAFYRDGDVQPLLGFVESKLLPVLSNRDYGAMNEIALKTLFLSLLFDDRRYTMFSELEAGHGYADLCLVRRPFPHTADLHDLLIELKYVALEKTRLSGAELRQLDASALRELAAVKTALAEAGGQIERYRSALESRFGDSLNLRCHAVVAVGLERLVAADPLRG